MERNSVLLDTYYKVAEPVKYSHPQIHFPLEKYGYLLEGTINNENRWHVKLVCNILGENLKRYVSTTYREKSDYKKLIKATALLKCNDRLCPDIYGLYPEDNTIICSYIGELFHNYLEAKPAEIHECLDSVYNYFKDINSINQTYRSFSIPSIINDFIQLEREYGDSFIFLTESKDMLSLLEDSGIQFVYGYGIEDPHIWNFRIANSSSKAHALTTDFDYFSDRINCFWELGYFYATFRWLKTLSESLSCQVEEILLSFIQNQDLKSEFMFWLGALSSYCGYKDSLKNLMLNGKINNLEEQYLLIQQLDKKISCLVRSLLEEKNI